jgi:uncharacterized membrane protein
VITPTEPTHIEDTVQAIARLRADHNRRATPLQRQLDKFMAHAGSPGFVVQLTLIVASWIALNSLFMVVDIRPINKPPFFWMRGVVALAALYMIVLILTTQGRENELMSRHEQLTLELAILSEQKAAKIISLLEELRQDHPEIHNRVDHEAAAMSAPADPQSVLESIKRHLSDDA